MLTELAAVRHGRWKCVTVKRGRPLELYDIEADPRETHNMADSLPQLVAQLDEAMRRLRRPSANYPIPEDSLSLQQP